MSGNFTQRGELAIADKYTRAKMAVSDGADLVVELPFPFSCLSAEGFAEAGVHILCSLGVDAISFGSECGAVARLEKIADAVMAEEFATVYSEIQKSSSLGSASAYFAALKQLAGVDAELLSNDILGISYISAIKRLEAHIDIVPVRRIGASYTETELKDGVLPSASAIRKAICQYDHDNLTDIENHIPKTALSVLREAINNGFAPVLTTNIGNNILSFFRLLTADEIRHRAISRCGGGVTVCEDGCGIVERLCRCASSAKSYDEFISSAYNAKYTDARVRRVMLFALLGVSDIISHSVPQYTTLLASSEQGRKFLAQKRKQECIEIVTKPADAPDDSVQTMLLRQADALYATAIPQQPDYDIFVKSSPFILK
jgi:predicted nucleotidyltransferase